ncbi:MAG TPA: xanthine dehydrogenase family protein molybdopterin-binding subunit, partial [Alphaproteobacteria bacterium]|nr:xanthine dehydrogenase family protein molybdopterin-binding subunit [Alphaproteobacteria bacterium]
VESSMSNMGYITTVLNAEERARAGPKNGALTIVTVALDPLGSVSVTIDSLPQGQGHRTAISQVMAEVFGIFPEEVTVESGFDSAVAGWSIAAGSYSSRFGPAVAGTAYLAATRLRDRLARLASQHLNVDMEELEFADGKICARDNPANSVPFRRIAGSSHWSPGTLPEGLEPVVRETATWTPPELTSPDSSDRINGAAAYGFIFDFCGIEIDKATHRVRIDHYVTMHDAGRTINPALLDGQIRGAFAHGIGAALLEKFRYDEDGQFLSGTFADYLVPTACEVPDPIILHTESPSPFTPLGTKGAGEGQSMSTPVCIANAVADALGVDDIELPLTPDRVAALMRDDEPPFRATEGK